MSGYNKRYNIVLPNGQQQTWDQDMILKKGNALFTKHPDASVTETEDFDESRDYSPESTFDISLADGRTETWNSDQWKQKGKALREKFPDAQVSVNSPYTQDSHNQALSANSDEEAMRMMAQGLQAGQRANQGILNRMNEKGAPTNDEVKNFAQFGGFDALKSGINAEAQQETARTITPEGEVNFQAMDEVAVEKALSDYRYNMARRDRLEELLREKRKQQRLSVGTVDSALSEEIKAIKNEIDALDKAIENAEKNKTLTEKRQNEYFDIYMSHIEGLDHIQEQLGDDTRKGSFGDRWTELAAMGNLANKFQSRELLMDHFTDFPEEYDEYNYAIARELYTEADDLLISPIHVPGKGIDETIGSFGREVKQRVTDPENYAPNFKKFYTMIARNIMEKLMDASVNLNETDIEATDLRSILTDSEATLWEAYMAKNNAEALRQGDKARGSQGAGIALDMVQFMAEIGVSHSLQGAAGRRAEAWMLKGLKRQLEKMAERGASRFLQTTTMYGGKYAANLATRMGQVGLAVTFAPGTKEMMYEKMLETNEDGTLKYGTQAGAYGSAWLNNYKEWFTETSGEMYGRIFKRAMDITGADKFLKKYVTSNIPDWFKGVTSTTNDALEFLGFHGTIGEVAEEVEGALIDRIAGDKQAWQQFWEGDNLVEMLIGFAPMSLLGLGGNMYQSYHDNKITDAERAFRNAHSENGWSDHGWKIWFDNARAEARRNPTIQGVADIVRNFENEYMANLINDGGSELTDEQKIQHLEAAQAMGKALLEDLAYESAQRAMLENEKQALRYNIYRQVNPEENTDIKFWETDENGNETVTTGVIYDKLTRKNNLVFLAKSGDSYLVIQPGKKGAPEFMPADQIKNINTYTMDQYLEGMVRGARDYQKRTAEKAANQSFFSNLDKAFKGGMPMTFSIDGTNRQAMFNRWENGQVVVEFSEPVTLNGQTGTEITVSPQEAGRALQNQVTIQEDAREKQARRIAKGLTTKDYLNEKFQGRGVTIDGKTYGFRKIYENPYDEEGTEMVNVIATDENGFAQRLSVSVNDLETQAPSEFTPAMDMNDGTTETNANLPMKTMADGTQVVDEKALLDSDMEAWARYHDSVMNDGGADTWQYLKVYGTALEIQRDTLTQGLNAEQDFDKRNEIRQQIDAINAKLAKANEILAKYIARSIADLNTTGVGVVIANAGNIEQKMREAGASLEAIGQVNSALSAGIFVEGFFDPSSATVYMLVESTDDLNEARSTFLHEQQHFITRANGFNEQLVQQYRDKYLNGMTDPQAIVQGEMLIRERLLNALHRLGADTIYDNKSIEAIADEVISYAREVMFASAEDTETALRLKGVEDEEIINFVKSIENETGRIEESLPDSGRTAPGSEGDGVADSGNEQAQGAGSSEVGEQGFGSPEGSEEVGFKAARRIPSSIRILEVDLLDVDRRIKDFGDVNESNFREYNALKAERTKLFETAINEVATEKTIVVSRSDENLVESLVSNGLTEDAAQRIFDAAWQDMGAMGFQISGESTIDGESRTLTLVDHCRTLRDGCMTYIHERRHAENKLHPETVMGVVRAAMFNHTALFDMIEAFGGARSSYEAKYLPYLEGANANAASFEYAIKQVADEVLAFADENYAAGNNLTALRIKADKLDNVHKEIIKFAEEELEKYYGEDVQTLQSERHRDDVSTDEGRSRDGEPDSSGRRSGSLGEQGTGFEERSVEATELDNLGLANNGDQVSFSARYSPTPGEAEVMVRDIMAEIGVPEDVARAWVASETSLAAIILDEENSAYLNYEGDDRYEAIKKDADYPQGTVDFNNICRKRLPFTNMYQRLQKAFPNTIITGEDLANIRQVMKDRGLLVACGLCYVEDRRQLLGEIAKDFIECYRDGFESYGKRGGETKAKRAVTLREMIGDDTKDDLNIYDLLTLDGSMSLYKEHRNIYDAFNLFNAYRGQQAGNLFQGYAEYKRDILKWDKEKVARVNSLGGLRVFSYSDFEAHHLIDLVQIIQDAARKGVMIQGYTKVPAFARAVANTNLKLNRSLIPLGDLGYHVEEDGRKVLDYDPVEGIDINDPDFLPSNENVGNILIGINDTQIGLAMLDPFVDYIIPYHSNQAAILRKLKQTGAWTNYKNYQVEKDVKTGKNAGHINIYTDVLDVAEKNGTPITNEREFVDFFLKVCKEKGLVPRFSQFLNIDENGDFAYRKGYYKLLLDFKLFDENGNILPQKPVVANFDDEFNKSILDKYVAEVKAESSEELDAAYNEVVEKLGLNERTPDISFKMSAAVRDEMAQIEALARLDGTYLKAPNGADTKLSPEQWALVRTNNFKAWFGDWQNDPENASKVVDENGEPMVVYHGSDYRPLKKEIGDGVFRERSGMFGRAVYFTNEYNIASDYADEKLDINENREYLKSEDKPDYIYDNGYVTEAFLNIRDSERIHDMPSRGENVKYFSAKANEIKSATDNNGEFSKENNDIRFKAKEFTSSIQQSYGSANTSLRQVASAFKKIDWQEGTTNLDLGGGKYDEATFYLQTKGVENLVFDPFNRDAESNKAIAERVKDGGVDTVTCNNVLNVIDSESARDNVILQAAKALRPNGVAYFSVYEGNKSGEGRRTGKDQWQNNRPTKDYLEEVGKHFSDVSVKNNVIIAKSPIATEQESVWSFDGTYDGSNQISFKASEYADKWFNSAKQEFGVTDDFDEAGYILPDGDMIDFSEKNDGGPAGQRSLDHRSIMRVMDDDVDLGSATQYMATFCDAGAVRIIPESAVFCFVHPLTQGQRMMLRRFMRANKGEIIVDIMDNRAYTQGYKEYDRWTEPDTVLAEIDDHFAGYPLGKETISFKISDKRKQTMAAQIHNKLTSMTDEQVQETIAEIERLGEEAKKGGDSKMEQTLVDWVCRGLIILPQDRDRAIVAYNYAKRFNTNTAAITNLTDYIEKTSTKVAEKEADKKPLNPDEEPLFTNRTVVSDTHGIVTYEVPDSKEGQMAVRKFVDSHFGKSANPWCLITRFDDGDALTQAWSYWKTYSNAGRKIAFQNGKLIAFMSSSTKTEEWWDRLDRSHRNIPIMVKFTTEDGLKVTAQTKISYSDADMLEYDGTYSVVSGGVEESYDASGNIVDTRYSQERDGQRESVVISYTRMGGRLSNPIEQVRRNGITSAAEVKLLGSSKQSMLTPDGRHVVAVTHNEEGRVEAITYSGYDFIFRPIYDANGNYTGDGMWDFSLSLSAEEKARIKEEAAEYVKVKPKRAQSRVLKYNEGDIVVKMNEHGGFSELDVYLDPANPSAGRYNFSPAQEMFDLPEGYFVKKMEGGMATSMMLIGKDGSFIQGDEAGYNEVKEFIGKISGVITRATDYQPRIADRKHTMKVNDTTIIRDAIAEVNEFSLTPEKKTRRAIDFLKPLMERYENLKKIFAVAPERIKTLAVHSDKWQLVHDAWEYYTSSTFDVDIDIDYSAKLREVLGDEHVYSISDIKFIIYKDSELVEEDPALVELIALDDFIDPYDLFYRAGGHANVLDWLKQITDAVKDDALYRSAEAMLLPAEEDDQEVHDQFCNMIEQRLAELREQVQNKTEMMEHANVDTVAEQEESLDSSIIRHNLARWNDGEIVLGEALDNIKDEATDPQLLAYCDEALDEIAEGFRQEEEGEIEDALDYIDEGRIADELEEYAVRLSQPAQQDEATDVAPEVLPDGVTRDENGNLQWGDLSAQTNRLRQFFVEMNYLPENAGLSLEQQGQMLLTLADEMNSEGLRRLSRDYGEEGSEGYIGTGNSLDMATVRVLAVLGSDAMRDGFEIIEGLHEVNMEQLTLADVAEQIRQIGGDRATQVAFDMNEQIDIMVDANDNAVAADAEKRCIEIASAYADELIRSMLPANYGQELTAQQPSSTPAINEGGVYGGHTQVRWNDNAMFNDIRNSYFDWQNERMSNQEFYDEVKGIMDAYNYNDERVLGSFFIEDGELMLDDWYDGSEGKGIGSIERYLNRESHNIDTDIYDVRRHILDVLAAIEENDIDIEMLENRVRAFREIGDPDADVLQNLLITYQDSWDNASLNELNEFFASKYRSLGEQIDQMNEEAKVASRMASQTPSGKNLAALRKSTSQILGKIETNRKKLRDARLDQILDEFFDKGTNTPEVYADQVASHLADIESKPWDEASVSFKAKQTYGDPDVDKWAKAVFSPLEKLENIEASMDTAIELAKWVERVRSEAHKADWDARYAEVAEDLHDTALEIAKAKGYPEGHTDNIKSGEKDSGFIADVFRKYNRDEYNAELFDKVVKVADMLGVRYKFLKTEKFVEGISTAGLITYCTPIFNSDIEPDQRKADTILHEMVHGVTTYAMFVVDTYQSSYQLENLYNQFNEKVIDAVDNLNKIYRELSADPEFHKHYGAKNAREMVAELTRADFREYLDGKSVWVRIKEAIKQIVDGLLSIVGMSYKNENTNGLEAVRNALDDILDYASPHVFSAVTNSVLKKKGFPKIGTNFDFDGTVPQIHRGEVSRTGEGNEDGAEDRQAERQRISFKASARAELTRKGLRGVMTPEALDLCMMNILGRLSGDIRSDITDAAMDNGGSFTDAVIERFAKMADASNLTPEDVSALNIAKDEIRKALDNETIEVNDVLWATYNDVHASDPLMWQRKRSQRIKRELGKAGSVAADMTLKDYLDAAEKAKDDILAQYQAMRAVAVHLTSIMEAMSERKAYDRAMVGELVNLANDVLTSHLIDNATNGEIKRLLGVIRRATGMKNIQARTGELYDLILSNTMKNLNNAYEKVMARKAVKVTSKKVKEQGSLDLQGQYMMDAYREGIEMTSVDEDGNVTFSQALSDKMNDVLDKMYNEQDKEKANLYEMQFLGLSLAKRYITAMTSSEAKEKALKDMIADADERLASGDMTKAEHKEFMRSAEELRRQILTERVENFSPLVQDLIDYANASHTFALDFLERDKQRINDIRHDANSDLEGTSAKTGKTEPTRLQALTNSGIYQFFSRSLATFDTMLKAIGRKSANGEGFLWNRFMRGWIDATGNEYLYLKDAYKALDDKMSEVFGKKMRWSDIYDIEKTLPMLDIIFKDANEVTTYTVPQGNALYIVLANAMPDGAMKLRKMGISEEDVQKIKDNLDPRILALGEWMVNEFLPSRREAYNEVHERMFGASMSRIANYFPLVVNKRDVRRSVDVATADAEEQTPSIITNAIMQRTVNALPLDITRADAFSVIIDNVQKMEHWRAFAEWNRDLSDLLSYNRFRNQLSNMTSVFGSKDNFFNDFRDVAMIAAGSYRPKTSKTDKRAMSLAKNVTAAKISLRVYTALKQFLSFPAYFAETNPLYLAESLATAPKAWNWAMENLPVFEKRWKSRQAGDHILSESEDWKSKVVELSARIGMTPNAFVDAMTVSIGAYAIYKTRLNGYLKDGFDQETAEKRAKQDATILYNETQQSSEDAFMSALQKDRSWLTATLTAFRNSSMGYGRMLLNSVIDLSKRAAHGNRKDTIAFMTKQFEADGLEPRLASRAAERAYRNQGFRDVLRIATFGYMMQFAWNLGSSLMYLLFGDDDDEKNAMIAEASKHALVGGWAEGLPFGADISEILNMLTKGEKLGDHDFSALPFTSDIASLISKTDNQDWWSAANDLTNIVAQMVSGVNPQTIEDIALAIYDAANGDLGLAKEIGFAIMRILQVPQSQVDKLFIDEVQMTAAEARDLSIPELAERYARYKTFRKAGPYAFGYSDEEEKKYEDSFIKRFTNDTKERILNEGENKQYLERVDAAKEQKKRVDELRKMDGEEADKELMGILSSEEYGRNLALLDMDKKIQKLIDEAWQQEKSSDVMAKIMEANNEKLLANELFDEESPEALAEVRYRQYTDGFLTEMSKLDKKYKEKAIEANPEYKAQVDAFEERLPELKEKYENEVKPRIDELEARLVDLPADSPARNMLKKQISLLKGRDPEKKRPKAPKAMMPESYMPEDIFNSPEYQTYLKYRDLGTMSGGKFRFKSVAEMDKTIKAKSWNWDGKAELVRQRKDKLIELTEGIYKSLNE